MQPQATVLHFIAQESQNVCVLGTLKERLTFMVVQLCLIRKKNQHVKLQVAFVVDWFLVRDKMPHW